jgi:hypothetical protein
VKVRTATDILKLYLNFRNRHPSLSLTNYCNSLTKNVFSDPSTISWRSYNCETLLLNLFSRVRLPNLSLLHVISQERKTTVHNQILRTVNIRYCTPINHFKPAKGSDSCLQTVTAGTTAIKYRYWVQYE